MKGARTRNLIKDAVLVLHGRKAWNAITLTDLCDATGLTIGAFYYHFRSKDQLGAEIAISFIDDGYAQAMASCSLESDFFEFVYSIISAFYQSYVRSPNSCHFAYFVLKSQESVFDHWLEARRPLLDKLRQEIEAARTARGQLDGAEAFVARWLLTNIEDFLWNVFMARGNQELHEIASGPDVFIRQQAILWHRAVLAETPTHPLARTARKSRPRSGRS